MQKRRRSKEERRKKGIKRTRRKKKILKPSKSDKRQECKHARNSTNFRRNELQETHTQGC